MLKIVIRTERLDSMSMEESSSLDKLLSASVVALPVMLMSVLGSLAYMLTVDDPRINTRRFVGTLLLSGVVAWLVLNFQLYIGVHPQLATVTAVTLGISGNKGFEWLLHKVKQGQE